MQWLAHHAGLPEPPASEPEAAGRNKRIDSRRVRELGFEFRYPTFREGFQALLDRGTL